MHTKKDILKTDIDYSFFDIRSHTTSSIGPYLSYLIFLLFLSSIMFTRPILIYHSIFFIFIFVIRIKTNFFHYTFSSYNLKFSLLPITFFESFYIYLVFLILDSFSYVPTYFFFNK